MELYICCHVRKVDDVLEGQGESDIDIAARAANQEIY
jgi:hypothetical protein